jgi:hypothetical protein
MPKIDYIVLMKKNFFVAALTLSTVTLASGLLSAPAKAQTADVEATIPITVEIPEIVFLETYDSLNFTASIGDLSGSSSDVISAGNGEVTISSSSITPALPTTSTLTFTNSKTVSGIPVYKIWGLGGATGKITHTVDTTGTLTKGASTVGLSVTDNLTADTAPGLDYADALVGTLDFEFDFTLVTESGSHSGMDLVITATAE